MAIMGKQSRIVKYAAVVLVILVWLGLSGVGGPYFGRIDEVSSNDMGIFLPKNAESTKVGDELSKFRDANTIPAIIVFESSNGIKQTQTDDINRVISSIEKTGVPNSKVSPAIISEDNKAAFVVVPLGSKDEFADDIPKLKAAVAETNPSVEYKFTGPAVFAEALNKAFAGIDGVLLLVALGVVFVILLVVYRSPILPVVTLMGAMLALSTAILVVWYMAKAGWIQLNGQVQGILFILVIGAATDYALLYIARYREELTKHTEKWDATKAALRGSWEPIAAAGGTVTLGLLCLVVSDLGSNKALGPVGGIGIIFAMLSALTFLPAVLLLIGRKAFWPRWPHFVSSKELDYSVNHPVWNKVGRLVSRHPRRLWVGFTALLIVACLFVPQLRANGVPQADFILNNTEAKDGQALLDRYFPAGSGSPLYVLTSKDDQADVVRQLDADNSVDSVSVVTSSNGSVAPVGKAADKVEESIRSGIAEKHAAQLDEIRTQVESSLSGAPQAVIDQAYSQATASVPSVDQLLEKAYPFTNVSPKVADGNVLLQAVLNDQADSLQARDTVKRLRSTVHATHPSTAFGGLSAIQLDTNTAAEHDLRIIIPLILVVITVILMVLLRSIIAPLMLLFTTLLSFGATLGVAALLFNHVWHFPGADPSVVIYGFVFLVALGIDYNIFLMTRVREENIRIGVSRGTIKALVVTGGVISSAGIVLASTFAALNVIPILFLAQIAFIVAFGVLLDTLIVRSLIVPSLTLEIGRRVWWPSKLARSGKK